jgi:hypothetical protein
MVKNRKLIHPPPPQIVLLPRICGKSWLVRERKSAKKGGRRGGEGVEEGRMGKGREEVKGTILARDRAFTSPMNAARSV